MNKKDTNTISILANRACNETLNSLRIELENTGSRDAITLKFKTPSHIVNASKSFAKRLIGIIKEDGRVVEIKGGIKFNGENKAIKHACRDNAKEFQLA